jgi:hypothetical protein
VCGSRDGRHLSGVSRAWMLDGYLAGSRYGMNQSKASPRIEYTQVETNVPKSDCLFVVTLISLGIIPHDACLPFTFVNTCPCALNSPTSFRPEEKAYVRCVVVLDQHTA